MRKAIWTSRHPLDPEAREALRKFGIEVVAAREILWPVDQPEILEIFRALLEEGFEVLVGVFPAQVHEAFRVVELGVEDGLDIQALSPVSEPVQEADGSRVRRFRFRRWAVVCLPDEGGN